MDARRQPQSDVVGPLLRSSLMHDSEGVAVCADYFQSARGGPLLKHVGESPAESHLCNVVESNVNY